MELLADIKDVRIELRMLSAVLKHQVAILPRLAEIASQESGKSDTRREIITKQFNEHCDIVRTRLSEVSKMDGDAAALYHSVYALNWPCKLQNLTCSR
jgi:hypothetical protein